MIPVDDDALASPIADGSRLCESQEECRSSIPPDDWLTSNDAHEDVSQEGLECPECRSLVPESRLASQGGVRAATAAHDATSSHSSCAHAPLTSLSLPLVASLAISRTPIACRSFPHAMPAKPRGHVLLVSLKNVYNDPWKWQLVKSWSWFAAGIYVAREFAVSLSEQPLP